VRGGGERKDDTVCAQTLVRKTTERGDDSETQSSAETRRRCATRRVSAMGTRVGAEASEMVKASVDGGKRRGRGKSDEELPSLR
jgi:hypothetical protein